MTEKARWEAMLRREPLDRVPLFLASLGFSLRMAGYPVARAYDDPKTCFQAQVETNAMFGATLCTRFIIGAMGAREFGGEVNMPHGEYAMAPSLRRPPIETEEDVPALEENPPDVRTAGAMPLALEFSRLQAAQGFPITLPVGGVLTGVGYMCGVNTMCRWMIKKPHLLHRVCRLFTQFILDAVKLWVDTFGPEPLVGWNVSPTESNQLISPAQFEEFALPYQKDIYERAQAMGVHHFYTHLCGEQERNLPHWTRFSHGDPGIISIGHEMDIGHISDHFPDQIILGNVNPTVIQFGTPEQVYGLAVACLTKGKECSGGFVLAPGCEMPILAPRENVRMLRKAVEDLGWYG
jgi:uroporphyrinogen decarboxylase